jgi:L-lactate dehydrogenase complex protein LldG
MEAQEPPMSARDEIFSNIRRSLGVRADDSARRAIVRNRIEAASPGIRPQRGEGDIQQRGAMFAAQAQSVAATVSFIEKMEDVPAEIARFLRDHNLPTTLRMGEDARIANLPWSETSLSITKGPSAGDDLNAVSHAEAGVAETGTLVIVSGAHNPSTLNFLPDNHIAILRAADIEATYEDALGKIRQRYGKGVMPRTVNLITGPSRSADIEQKLLLGAHGPRRLHIVIVKA